MPASHNTTFTFGKRSFPSAHQSMRIMRPMLVVFFALVIPSSGIALAGSESTYWTAGTGDWSEPANWDNGVPNSDDTAVIVGGNPQITVGEAEANYLNMKDGLLELIGGSLTIGRFTGMGFGANDVEVRQNGGTQHCTGNFAISNTLGASTASFSLNGPGLLQIDGSLSIGGWDGEGTFQHTNGTVLLGGNAWIGYSGGG
jgi:hypothetical protein